MKVNILLTKEVPGDKRVLWPEVPDWVWSRLGHEWPYVVVLFGGSNPHYPVTIYGTNKCPAGFTYRAYCAHSRELFAENITPGPWVVQEPPQLVPLTVDELLERFFATEWAFLKVYSNQSIDNFGSSRSAVLAVNHASPGTLLALNRRTFECIKIAEVVE